MITAFCRTFLFLSALCLASPTQSFAGEKPETWGSAAFKGAAIGVPLVFGTALGVATLNNMGSTKQVKDPKTGEETTVTLGFFDAFGQALKTVKKHILPIAAGCGGAVTALTCALKFGSKLSDGPPKPDVEDPGKKPPRPPRRHLKGSNLFLGSGEFENFFVSSDLCDPCWAVYGFKEADFMAMSLQDRIKLLDKVKVDGQSFWDLVGVAAGSDEKKMLDGIRDRGRMPSADEVGDLYGNFGFRFDLYPAKELCQEKDAWTSGGSAFSGTSRFTVLPGRTIQALMRDFPEAFDGSAVQSASRDSSFEAHFDGLGAVKPGSLGLRSYQYGVQGETIALGFLSASVLRKYIEEPILAEMKTLWFGNGINMDPERAFLCGCATRCPSVESCPNATAADVWIDSSGNLNESEICRNLMVGIQKNSTVTLCADEESKPYRLEEGVSGKGKPSTLGKAKKKIVCSYLPTFAVNLKNVDPLGKAKKPISRRAKKLLKLQMLGAVKAAYLDGKKKVFLTCVGLGVFKNNHDWFIGAMGPALDFAKQKNMHIVLIDYSTDKSIDDSAGSGVTRKTMELARKKGIDRRVAKTDTDIKARFGIPAS